MLAWGAAACNAIEGLNDLCSFSSLSLVAFYPIKTAVCLSVHSASGQSGRETPRSTVSLHVGLGIRSRNVGPGVHISLSASQRDARDDHRPLWVFIGHSVNHRLDDDPTAMVSHTTLTRIRWGCFVSCRLCGRSPLDTQLTPGPQLHLHQCLLYHLPAMVVLCLRGHVPRVRHLGGLRAHPAVAALPEEQAYVGSGRRRSRVPVSAKRDLAL